MNLKLYRSCDIVPALVMFNVCIIFPIFPHKVMKIEANFWQTLYTSSVYRNPLYVYIAEKMAVYPENVMIA